MIDGHGDDTYKYKGICMNFSSNIYAHADLSELEEHLCRNINIIQSYPEPSPTSLENLIAQSHEINANEVMVTSGATDAIYLIAQTFRHLQTFHSYHPTFSEYDDACRQIGYEERSNGAIGWLCNPNNPTGLVLQTEDIISLANKHEILVIDQSYEDYTMQDMLTPAQALKYNNIIQIHSLTKRYVIPGLRIGYITSQSNIINKLRKGYRPWAVNAMAIEAGKWLISHKKRVLPDLEKYLGETQRLRNILNSINGITVSDTQTNFMLCRIEQARSSELKDYLVRNKGMLIRDASNFPDLSAHHFRIATQNREENNALADAIIEFIDNL